MATSVMTEKLTAGCTFDETQHKNVCNESGGSTRPSLVRAGNETLRLVPIMSLHVVDNTCVIYSRHLSKTKQARSVVCPKEGTSLCTRACECARACVQFDGFCACVCVLCVCVCVCFAAIAHTKIYA